VQRAASIFIHLAVSLSPTADCDIDQIRSQQTRTNKQFENVPKQKYSEPTAACAKDFRNKLQKLQTTKILVVL
jgi:hypothetical protein